MARRAGSNLFDAQGSLRAIRVTESSENFSMMHMDMAGPNTESHAENFLTCGSPDRSERSDSWRIDVEEVLDCDADGPTPEALP
jgi:hypothetical protein